MVGHVARAGKDQAFFGDRGRPPSEPAPGLVGSAVAVFEVDDVETPCELLHRRERGLAVVRVDEFDECLAQQVLRAIAEDPGEGRVDVLEIAIETGDAEQVERQVEQPAEACLSRKGVARRGAAMLCGVSHLPAAYSLLPMPKIVRAAAELGTSRSFTRYVFLDDPSRSANDCNVVRNISGNDRTRPHNRMRPNRNFP